MLYSLFHHFKAGESHPMNSKIPYTNINLEQAMNREQFTQLVDAILEGKYSWACVLILRAASYNPLHYIPYRTYNRLMKENCQIGTQSKNKTDSINTDKQTAAAKLSVVSSGKPASPIADLGYLEVVSEAQTKLRGGYFGGLLYSVNQQELYNFSHQGLDIRVSAIDI
jgi:hypothetical protein